METNDVNRLPGVGSGVLHGVRQFGNFGFRPLWPDKAPQSIGSERHAGLHAAEKEGRKERDETCRCPHRDHLLTESKTAFLCNTVESENNSHDAHPDNNTKANTTTNTHASRHVTPRHAISFPAVIRELPSPPDPRDHNPLLHRNTKQRLPQTQKREALIHKSTQQKNHKAQADL